MDDVSFLNAKAGLIRGKQKFISLFYSCQTVKIIPQTHRTFDVSLKTVIFMSNCENDEVSHTGFCCLNDIQSPMNALCSASLLFLRYKFS